MSATYCRQCFVMHSLSNKIHIYRKYNDGFGFLYGCSWSRMTNLWARSIECWLLEMVQGYRWQLSSPLAMQKPSNFMDQSKNCCPNKILPNINKLLWEITVSTFLKKGWMEWILSHILGFDFTELFFWFIILRFVKCLSSTLLECVIFKHYNIDFIEMSFPTLL